MTQTNTRDEQMNEAAREHNATKFGSKIDFKAGYRKGQADERERAKVTISELLTLFDNLEKLVAVGNMKPSKNWIIETVVEASRQARHVLQNSNEKGES